MVHGKDLYRGVALIGLELEETEAGIKMTGRAYNRGTELASLTRLTSTLFDLDGKPIWVQANFLEANLISGQEQSFAFILPPRSAIEIYKKFPVGNWPLMARAFLRGPMAPALCLRALSP